MKTVYALLSVVIFLQMAACATQQYSDGYVFEDDVRVILSGFTSEQRKQIENRLRIDDLRIIECSVRNCEYDYHGSYSMTELYRKLQHSLGAVDLDLSATIEVENSVITVTVVQLKNQRRVAPGNKGW